jgi:hypothetical protein
MLLTRKKGKKSTVEVLLITTLVVVVVVPVLANIDVVLPVVTQQLAPLNLFIEDQLELVLLHVVARADFRTHTGRRNDRV